MLAVFYWIEGVQRRKAISSVDRINWDNYNESGDLKNQIKAYRDRFGYYPESVHADKIYRNRKNRKFCKRHGIRLSGPAMGRPPKEVDPERKRQARQDESDRILIEGKFGQGKRRFSLSKIMCKLARTSETAIGIVFLVMNIERWLKAILFCLFSPGQASASQRFGGRIMLVRLLVCDRNTFFQTKNRPVTDY
jgi:hypothetical protein